MLSRFTDIVRSQYMKHCHQLVLKAWKAKQPYAYSVMNPTNKMPRSKAQLALGALQHVICRAVTSIAAAAVSLQECWSGLSQRTQSLM